MISEIVHNKESCVVTLIGRCYDICTLLECRHTIVAFEQVISAHGQPGRQCQGLKSASSERIVADFRHAVGNLDLLQGLAVRGSKAQNDAEGTAADVAAWLKELGLK